MSLNHKHTVDKLNWLSVAVHWIPIDGGLPVHVEFTDGSRATDIACNIAWSDVSYYRIDWVADEVDPNGVGQHEVGSKLDAGKNRLGLVLGGFSHALQAVGEVGTFGANKYTDNGWKSVPNGSDRYTDAMLRHYFKEQSGELRDSDSDLFHAAHLAWNALARLELLLSGSGVAGIKSTKHDKP